LKALRVAMWPAPGLKRTRGEPKTANHQQESLAMHVDHPPSPPAPRERSRPFRLTRFFSLTSLIGIVAVTACLFWTYRELTERHLVEHESRANADLTRAFANAVWGRYRSFVLESTGRPREALLADPAVPLLRAEVMSKMNGLQIAKVKIYNLDGLTVFSTDEKQIGENKGSNPGFRQARAGEVTSQIVFREKFDAFEGALSNRNLIASYVPARATADAPIEGVFEVYSDVTELMQTQTRAQWQVAGIVLTLLATLYLFLFLVVRKADRIIALQDQERAAKEQQVRHQAYHDALTGLPNRAYFSERLGETIALAQRTNQSCALMFVDLDRFKIVNDSLGHEAGDSLLKVVSARIHACLRESDLLFRMGGDEFTVILSQITAPEDAAFVARRVQEAVAAPVSVHEHELAVGATIGIAVYPGDGDSAEALLKNADAAMYSAKENGRGRHAFYRSAMNQRASQRLGLEVALKKGFRDGEFTLYYQPRVDAASRRIVALEALLRWVSPSRGLVPPGEFIGVLEDTGMMTIVGEWVLRSACTQVCRWREQGMAPLRVSVNVSSVQFQNSGFVTMVQRVLRETGTPPELIELELTESLLMANIAQARTTIDALKALGLRISIDDFGTGYSSLNYLRQFAVDFLKIDRSFVVDIASNPRDRAVVVAIIELAKALDIAVVAEGVETEPQATFFCEARCDEFQGFLFCRPLPVDQVELHVAAASKAGSVHQRTLLNSVRGLLQTS
jgi:diguanylate cyclase (GGDEF)-like protein